MVNVKAKRTIEDVLEEVEKKIQYYDEFAEECLENGDEEGWREYLYRKFNYQRIKEFILGESDEIHLC